MLATLLLFSAALFSAPQCASDAASGAGTACCTVNCQSAGSQKPNAKQDASAKPSYLIEVIDPAKEIQTSPKPCAKIDDPTDAAGKPAKSLIVGASYVVNIGPKELGPTSMTAEGADVTDIVARRFHVRH
jgi:hypothetical protein